MKVFSLPSSVVSMLPLYEQLSTYAPEERDELVKIRLQCFSKNTIFNYANGIKPYIKFCEQKNISPLPAERIELELFSIFMINQGKSAQSIENVIKSLIFCSNFGGIAISLSDKNIKYL